MLPTLYQALTRLSDSRDYLVAYSGGIDSHVLLHALVALRQQYPDIRLRAIHVHHGLHDQSDAWSQHCQLICRHLEVSLIVKKVAVDRHTGQGIEAAARAERYQAFAEKLALSECLLTAHTQDDQAETLLLQLLRGSGPKGLSAMPRKKSFTHGLHLRPLLSVTRDDIVEYAQSQALQWVEDSSNLDERFDRNYLRHQVMPLLKSRWPSALNNLARSAGHCANTVELLTDIAEKDLFALQGSQTDTLSISGLLMLSATRRANVLRYWLSLQGCQMPSTAQLLQCDTDVLQSRSDATPSFSIDGKVLRRYQDDLFLMDSDSLLQQQEIAVDSWPPEYQHLSHLSHRFRQGGERIKPAGSQYTQSLKKLFQQWGVPPWERDRVPLLFDGDRLVAVVGYCMVDIDSVAG